MDQGSIEILCFMLSELEEVPAVLLTSDNGPTAASRNGFG
jgi:hypothetical protein